MNMMRTLRIVVFSFAALSASAWAEEYQSVTFSLTNGTEQTIDQFYASPPDTDAWEADILGQDVLESGDSVTITINDGREDCNYDFKAVFEDGTELEHDAITVCDGEEYTYQ